MARSLKDRDRGEVFQAVGLMQRPKCRSRHRSAPCSTRTASGTGTMSWSCAPAWSFASGWTAAFSRSPCRLSRRTPSTTATIMPEQASASLWLVPFAVTVLGRVADHVPKATLLGLGVMGWGLCTMLTGMSQSFGFLLVSRVLAGLSNCAGYPVAVSLIAEFFNAREMTTAMGYFNAGCQCGTLLGLGLGGTLITQMGWRTGFLIVASPQLVLAILLLSTVRSKPQPSPKRSWCGDLAELLRMSTVRYVFFAAFLHGLMSGNGRFISAFVERSHNMSAQTVGLSLSLASGFVGLLAACGGGHLIDHICKRMRDLRALLWCASAGLTLRLVFGSCALTSPHFGVFMAFYALDSASSSLQQGIDTVVQMLGEGRRGTTQALMELSWSVGMGVGPFLGGVLSDSLMNADCDSGCALGQSLLIVLSFGMAIQGFAYLMASGSLRDDVAHVKASVSAKGGSKEAPSGAPSRSPDFGAAALRDVPVEIDEVSDGEFDTGVADENRTSGLCEDFPEELAGSPPSEQSSAEPRATTLGRSPLE